MWYNEEKSTGRLNMDHSEYAAELFLKGYNCAQAVAVAFCDVTDIFFDGEKK